MNRLIVAAVLAVLAAAGGVAGAVAYHSATPTDRPTVVVPKGDQIIPEGTYHDMGYVTGPDGTYHDV